MCEFYYKIKKQAPIYTNIHEAAVLLHEQELLTTDGIETQIESECPKQLKFMKLQKVSKSFMKVTFKTRQLKHKHGL